MLDSAGVARIGRVDIVGTMVPGFYLLCNLSTAILAAGERSALGSVWDRIGSLLAHVESWPGTVLVLLSSYILGTIPRGFPAGMTDRFFQFWWDRKTKRKARTSHATTGTSSDREASSAKRVEGTKDSIGRGEKHSERRRASWQEEIYRGKFPYAGALYAHLRSITKAAIGEGDALDSALDERLRRLQLRDAMEGVHIATFDYWKTVLNQRCPSAFALAQVLEGRVRMFVGMFWASCLSFTLQAAAAISILFTAEARAIWLPCTFGLLLASALFALFFGWRLRFVRAEEAHKVFLGYLAHVESEFDETEAGPKRLLRKSKAQRAKKAKGSNRRAMPAQPAKSANKAKNKGAKRKAGEKA